jgi:hypothetical protein
MATVRGAAAPMPCTRRAASRISRRGGEVAGQRGQGIKAGADMMTRLRPKASERGPVKRVPIPMPRTKLVTTSCAAFGASGERVAAISGQGGQHRVDGNRDGGEEHGDERHEFDLRDGRVGVIQLLPAVLSSAMTLSQVSVGCAPETTYCWAIRKVGTAFTPFWRASVAGGDVVGIGVGLQQAQGGGAVHPVFAGDVGKRSRSPMSRPSTQ